MLHPSPGGLLRTVVLLCIFVPVVVLLVILVQVVVLSVALVPVILVAVFVVLVIHLLPASEDTVHPPAHVRFGPAGSHTSGELACDLGACLLRIAWVPGESRKYRGVAAHLDQSLHHRPIGRIETAYICGWRRGELLALQWAQVDWESGTIRLERGTTKSGEPRTFPFGAHPRLAGLLRAQRQRTSAFERATGSVCPWVFHRNGRRLRGWYYDSWRTACRKAGVPGRLVHDLRRSAVRNLIRAGVSEQVAMTLSGHKTRSVFDRYNITSSADQREAVQKLAALQGGAALPARNVASFEINPPETGILTGIRGGRAGGAPPQSVAAHGKSLKESWRPQRDSNRGLCPEFRRESAIL